jgi:hypothetical protein
MRKMDPARPRKAGGETGALNCGPAIIMPNIVVVTTVNKKSEI